VALPETRYAANGGLHVAYQLVGDGPVDLVLLTQWFSNIDSQWDVPPLAAFIRQLATFSRVVTFDKRGTGLSDPVPAAELPSIEECMDDLRTVLDDSGIDRAVLVANLASSFMAMVFAATPRRAPSASGDHHAHAGDLTRRSGHRSCRAPALHRRPCPGRAVPGTRRDR